MSSFLKTFLPAISVVLLADSTLQASDRPNILIIFADDWGRFASAYARSDGPGSPNDVVQTPSFDRIAQEGVLFRRAFVGSPSCTPCRSALLTGQYFWRTGPGAILHAPAWDETLPVFPLLLGDAGYQLGKSYKVWGPGNPVDAPYGKQRFAYEKAGRRFNDFSEHVTHLVSKGQPVSEIKESLLDEVGRNFEMFLDVKAKDQPFCFWFGPTNVHRKWVKGSGKAIWGIAPDSLEGKLPPFLADVPEVREDFADYLGEIQALDAAIGKLLAILEARGELDRTLIAVSGDHGPPGFTHGKCDLYDFGTAVSLAIRGPGIPPGRVVDDFVHLMDLAPTFLDAAQLPIPEVMTGRSLLPVLRSDKSGQVDPSRTFVITGRERHVGNAREGNLPYPQRALRTKDHLFVINFEPDRWPMGDPYRLDTPRPPSANELTHNTYATFRDMDQSPTKAWLVLHRTEPENKKYFEMAFARRPREELYILASDPHQIHNVAGEPEHQETVQLLRDQLLAELKRAGDPRATGDDLFEKPPFVDGPKKGSRLGGF
jgi:arylsulfatase A-like enzyme